MIHSQIVLTVAAHPATIELYSLLMNDSKNSIVKIEHIEGDFATRAVADIIILEKALIAGEIDFEIEFISVPNAARARNLVFSGKALISSSTFFSSSFIEDVYKSREILPAGAYIKGIYCLESNSDLLSMKSLDELKNFTAVSLRSWKLDWSTLEKLDLRELNSVNNFEFIYNLIGKRGVDFSLMEIPNGTDFHLEFNGITLIPVPDILISLNDSRHFMVSRQHPVGEVVYQSLERGLEVLNKTNIIRNLMTDAGFYRKDLESWQILNLE